MEEERDKLSAELELAAEDVRDGLIWAQARVDEIWRKMISLLATARAQRHAEVARLWKASSATMAGDDD